MKKFTILFILLVKMAIAFAQAPNLINYQGVARDAAGNVILNKTIKLRLTIRNNTAGGPSLYSETRSFSTGTTGTFSVQIGGPGASATTGNFTTINWGNGAKFLQVEMDPNNGSTFANMGTQQLVSVPYALQANEAGTLSPLAKINPSQLNAEGAVSGQVLRFNGTAWVPFTLPTTTGGTFTLPFSATGSVTGSAAMFQLWNQGTGISLNASSTGTGSIGVRASGQAKGLEAISHQGIALDATSTYGTAVRGISSSSTGVFGNSASGIGVMGTSSTGTGMRAASGTGLALDVFGRMRIAGGNTNPVNGGRLTSDASGNAVWKPSRVAFSAELPPSSWREIANAQLSPVLFDTEKFDAGNNFTVASQTPRSRFKAPVSGYYQFNAGARFQALTIGIINYGRLKDVSISIRVFRNGQQIDVVTAEEDQRFAGNYLEQLYLSLSDVIYLTAGDEVELSSYCKTSNDMKPKLWSAHFSGHLAIPD